MALENDILVHFYRPRTKNLDRACDVIKQLVVPEKYKPAIVIALHDQNSHPGSLRVFETVKRRFFFHVLFNFLQLHINTSMECQVSK